jgi:DnaJ-class molecular chaperone
LLVKIEVAVPKTLTDEQRAAIEALAVAFTGSDDVASDASSDAEEVSA